MVMRDVFRQRTFQRAPAEEDHAAKTFLLHRAHESLSEGIKIRRPRRQTDHVNSMPSKHPAEGIRVLCIPIHNQDSSVPQELLIDVGKIASDLHHPLIAWMRCDTGNLHPASSEVELSMGRRHSG